MTAVTTTATRKTVTIVHLRRATTASGVSARMADIVSAPVGRSIHRYAQRRPVIDMHSHILPGVDDGSPDLDMSLSMARAAVREGTQTMVATPHVSFEHQLNPAEIGLHVG